MLDREHYNVWREEDLLKKRKDKAAGYAMLGNSRLADMFYHELKKEFPHVIYIKKDDNTQFFATNKKAAKHLIEKLDAINDKYKEYIAKNNLVIEQVKLQLNSVEKKLN